MRYLTIAVIAALLLIGHVSGQTQPVLTGSDVPDAAAWRIWLNQKGEVPGNHSVAFTTYLVSLGLSQADTAVLNAALESYATQETTLRTTINAKIEAADENFDAATASGLQTAFQTKLAALVSATQSQLASHLSPEGTVFLTKFIQGEKRHMTISPLDVALAQTRTMIYAEPAAFHAHGAPQGTQMHYSYSTYGSTWLSVAGTNSSGEPYGTFYTQIGAQGTTSSCTGQCLSAYHSAVTEYNHAGGGTQRYTVADQPANNSMNASYVYSWPFDATNNYYWPSETAWVYVQCTIAGIFLQNNPIGGGDPFQFETALTYTTTQPQVVLTCYIQPSCNPVELSRSSGTLTTYCTTLYPDYVPNNLQFIAQYGESFLEFQQWSPCDRVTGGQSWSCVQEGLTGNGPYNYAFYSQYELKPSVGGAKCTHTP